MTRLGDYELWAQIGVGSTGAVWKAHRRGPVPQVVALKRLRVTSGGSGELARIRREATILTELNHPHIVRLIDVLEDGDGLAMAMQLAAGGSLEALLAERGQLAPGEVVAVAAPIADALSSAHRRGIIHGDVKAANVLLTSDGEPLLADFDVAHSFGCLANDEIAGTAEYLAPELLDGAVPDQRSDIYSLAAVCYEALAGYPRYAGAVPASVVPAPDGGRRRFARVPDLQGRLADVVERAMARDPDHRFASADAFARALRSSVPREAIGLPGTATTNRTTDDKPCRRTQTFGPRPPRPETKPKRWRIGNAALVIGMAAVRAVRRRQRAGHQRRPRG